MTELARGSRPSAGIRNRPELLLMLAVVVPMSVLALVATRGLAEIRQALLGERAAAAEAMAAHLDLQLKETLQHLAAVPAPVPGQDQATAAQREALRGAWTRSRLLGGALLVDADGAILGEEPSAAGRRFDPARQGGAKEALRTGQPALLVEAGAGAAPTVWAVVPLIDWHRQVRGAAVGIADPGAATWRGLFRYQPPGWSGRVELVDERAQVLSATVPCSGLGPQEFAAVLRPLLAARAGAARTTRGAGGSAAIAFAPLAMAPWGVVLTQPEAGLFGPLDTLRRRWAMAALAFAGIGAIFAWGVARSVNRPLATLMVASERLAAGELDHPVPPLGVDEVGRLGRSFETMRLALRATVDELRRANGEMEARVAARTSELARLYEELQRRDEARTKLLRRLITVQEEERKRIAREIHDETCQTVAALSMRLQLVEQAQDPAERSQRLAESVALARRSLDELHQVMFRLRPSVLDDLGLIAAIRWLADRQSAESGVRAHLDLEEPPSPLPFEISIALFRAVQEAISNVVRHAHAESIWIRVGLDGGAIEAEVEDDGQGFDPAEVRGPAESGRGLGLLGLRERIEDLGGTVRVDSRPGAGTRVLCRVPLPSGGAPVAAG